MKKISAKTKRIGNDSLADEATILGGTEAEGQEGDEVTPIEHLAHVGVKLEDEGQSVGRGLLEAVEEVVEPPWEEISQPDIPQAYVVDLTQQFNRIFVQTTFNNFKEFEMLFNKFKAESGSVFRIKSSCSVAYENSRRKKHFIPSRFKFVTVRYCCVHYGQPKVAGQGIRIKQRYLPCGCKSMLSLSYNRGALVISQANMQHNHEVSSEMAPFYAINRRISNAELKEVAGVVDMIPSSRALQHFLQINFHRPTTLQDAKNVRARLKALKVPQASVTKPPMSAVSKELGIALLKVKEEGKEELQRENEEVVIDGINSVDFNVKDEVVGEVQIDECDYWGETIQQHQEEAEDEEEEQESDLGPGMRRKVLNEVRTRLLSVLESCSTKVFQERVSVLEKLIEGWENDEPVHIEYMEKSDFKTRTLGLVSAYGTNTNIIQQKKDIENDKNGNLLTPINSTNTALPVLGMKGKSQFFSTRVKNKLGNVSCKSQSKVDCVMEITNENISTINHISSCENSSQLYKTDTRCFTGIENSRSNEKRPIITSIVKGFIGGSEQAMEVEIEVNGKEAKVKAVRREPLDYYEVNVGD